MQSHFTNNIFISKSLVITKLQVPLPLSCYFTQGLKKIQSQQVAPKPVSWGQALWTCGPATSCCSSSHLFTLQSGPAQPCIRSVSSPLQA